MVNQGPAQNILDQHPAANGKIVKVHKRKKRFGSLVREDPDAPPQCPSKVKRFRKYPFFFKAYAAKPQSDSVQDSYEKQEF